MFPISKKFLIFIAAGVFFIVIGVFIYVQMLFLKIDDGNSLAGKDLRVFECPTEVVGKKEASECFNVFFEKTFENLVAERGEENMSDYLIDLYSEVSEENIFIFEGTYQIEKNGHGTPYFIENGFVIRR